MKETTLVLFIKKQEQQILLGYKKRGFGVGKYSGFGGKLQEGESLAEGAVREIWEEVGLTIDGAGLNRVARLDFHFPAKKEWDLHLNAYLVTEWEGDPEESEEMAPVWFSLSEIPYQQMWPDSILWMPAVLDGRLINGQFRYKENNEDLADSYICYPPENTVRF